MRTNVIKSLLKANIIGDGRKKSNPSPPEENITDALLMEDGSLFLMEDGTYFMLEKAAQPQSATPKINKSYWNF
jgi:hypothetical protein